MSIYHTEGLKYCTFEGCRRPVIARCNFPASPAMQCGAHRCELHTYYAPDGSPVCWAHREWRGETCEEFLLRSFP